MKTKVVLWVLLSILIFPIMTKSQEKVRQTAGHDALGEFAPEFAHLNDDILFGEVWSRNDLLSLRDRSIVTVVALMSQGLTDSSFKYHLESAKKNGVTKIEISNTTPLPAKIYANEGIAQVLFLEGDTPCETTYKDKRGKYQGQTGITLPRILK
jgi:alkylhydroperoxidase/carboxymuconolactone decarboxylase family protein YurZ